MAVRHGSAPLKLRCVKSWPETHPASHPEFVGWPCSIVKPESSIIDSCPTISFKCEAHNTLQYCTLLCIDAGSDVAVTELSKSDQFETPPSANCWISSHDAHGSWRQFFFLERYPYKLLQVFLGRPHPKPGSPQQFTDLGFDSPWSLHPPHKVRHSIWISNLPLVKNCQSLQQCASSARCFSGTRRGTRLSRVRLIYYSSRHW